MITPTQLQDELDADVFPDDDLDHPGEQMNTPLTEAQQKLLMNVVKSYPPYAFNRGLYPDLDGKIDQEQIVPTITSYFLKAVLTALDNLPEVSADANGTDKAPGFFSTTSNWGILAQDILNCFYDVPLDLARQSYGVTRPSIEYMIQNQDFAKRKL